MAKKLLVRTPVTQDGLTPVYDDNKQAVYKESIVELAAKTLLTSENNVRPKVLQHEISEVEVDDTTGEIVKPKAAKDEKAGK